jgi:hypothetical protein
MATTIGSVTHVPHTSPLRHRAALALAAGIIVTGGLAIGTVLVDDTDGSSPVPQERVTNEAAVEDDPLFTRFAAPDAPYVDQVTQDRLMRFSSR